MGTPSNEIRGRGFYTNMVGVLRTVSRCGLVRTSSVFTASYSNITEIYLQIYVIMEFEV